MRNEIRRLMGQELHSLVVQKSGNVNPFCEQNGFSATHLWKVIKGTGNVGLDQLERYCEKLGISLDRFLYASLTQRNADDIMEFLEITKDYSRAEINRLMGYAACLRDNLTHQASIPQA